MIRWLKDNWGVAIVLAAGLIVGILMLVFLQPREPNLPAYEYSEGRTANYQPGGRGCEPQVLASIRERAKALAERDRCANEAEEHRLKSDDLVQQARTADATAAQTALTLDLTRFALWGTVGGLLTLIAASLAAYFARNAAYAARGSLDAFSEVERADIIVTLEHFEFSNIFNRFGIVANNLGRSAALVTAVGVTWKESSDLASLGGWLGDDHPKIVPAADKELLKTERVEIEQLRKTPYMWLLVNTRSPLRGHVSLRYCFHIFERPSDGVGYIEEYSDELDQNAVHVAALDKPRRWRWPWQR